MKQLHYIHFLAAASAALVLVGSCTPESITGPEGEEGIIIRLAPTGMQTKTDGTADENAVNTLDVFIFSSDGNTKYYYEHVDSPTLSGTYYEQRPKVGDLSLSGTSAQKADALKVAKVFAIANYKGGATLSGKTLAEVNALAVDASEVLSSTDILEGEQIKKMVADHPVFVMTADGSLNKSGDALLATLPLKRLMSKFTLEISYKSSIVKTGTDTNFGETTTTWTPITGGENVRVYLENAVSNARLDATAPASYTYFTYADTYPTASGEKLNSPALYSYPQSWTAGSNQEPFIKLIQPWRYVTTIERSGETIVIDENVVELYYKIMLPATELVANTWYQPKVTLDVLGGEATRPTQIVPTYFQVLAWGEASDVGQINVAPPKYLVPEALHLTVNNGNKLKVKFLASGNVTMRVKRIHKQVFGNALMLDREIYPERHPNVEDIYNDSWVTLTNINADGIDGNDDDNVGYINLEHTLSDKIDDNSVTNFAARPYIYEIQLRLTSDDPAVEESWKTVEITQNPPILVDGQLSFGYVNVNGVKYGSRTYPGTDAYPNPGYAWVKLIVEGTQYYSYSIGTNRSRANQIGSTETFAYLDPSKKNSSRYRIIVKAPTVSGKYVVDPRVELASLVPDNPTADPYNDTYGTYSDLYKAFLTRRTDSLATTTGIQFHTPLTGVTDDALKAYMPTMIDSDNLIAPEFMFASSYGKTQHMRYPSAALRCAAYQEDGYPAGRWRLPTKAEIEMCIKLQEKGAIPNLFNKDISSYSEARYPAASGYYYGKDNTSNPVGWYQTNNSTKGSVQYLNPRCVYDTWYWGREEVDDCMDKSSTTTYTESITEGDKTESVTRTIPAYHWGGYKFTK